MENEDSQLAPLEVISSLVTRLLRTMQEGRLVKVKIPPEEGTGSSSAVPEVGDTERGHSTREWARVCFSCGRPGNGVNRCPQVDTSFPFLPTGCSVDVRDGQYRAVQIGGTGKWSTPGNEGWSGREGQPPGPLGIQVQLTPPGGDGGSRRGWPAWQLPVGRGAGHGWASDTHAFPPLGSHPTEVCGHDNRQLPIRTKPVLGSRNPIVPDSPIGMGGAHSRCPPPPVSGARKNGRGMWPAGGDMRSPLEVKDEPSDVMVTSDGPDRWCVEIIEWCLCRWRRRSSP